MLLGKEPALRGKATNDDDKRGARRIMATILNQGEQRSWKDECVRIIRSGGPLPTIQVKSSGSQTSSGSRPRPPALPNVGFDHSLSTDFRIV